MTIKRLKTGDRMSQAVIHNGTVYLAGQVAQNAPGASVADQTKDILAAIDGLLAEAGTDKSKALSATIWLNSMDDFAEMNGVWDAWVAPGATPARACVESPRLAAPQFTVEIGLIAALE
jgi:enamine deaminase RidA (YjgF/YER057c/UK114 family)